MRFDFELFSRLAEREYNTYDDNLYFLEEVLWVFQAYFVTYEYYFKKPHPPIRAEQICRIIGNMPFIELEHGPTVDIEKDNYKDIILKHFDTRYRNCDYNINHFFSGNIRKLRYYEVCY